MSDINTNRRLFDLVRYQRAELHEANLITDEEYGLLCTHEFPEDKNKQGSPSPRRLEDYDELRKKSEALAASHAELVTALEKSLHVIEHGTFTGSRTSMTDLQETLLRAREVNT